MIVAFKSPSPLAGLTELPTRLKIGKWGRNVTGKGEGFTVNERTAAVLPLVQQAMSFDRVALDFEHNTVPTVGDDGKPVPPKEPQKVAAHGTPEVVPGDGLYLKDLKWTPEGSEAALGGHYPDLSPAVKMNDAGEVLFLHSAGICRQGSVMDLAMFSAALSPTQLAAFSAATAHSPSTQNTMDYKKLLLLILGQPETATDSDIESGAKAFAAKIGKLGELEQFAASVQKLGGLEKFSASLKALDSSLEKVGDAEKTALIAQAIRDGKIVPHSANKLPLENLKEILAELPANVVPLAQRTVEGVKSFSAGFTGAAGGNASVEAEVARQMNVSPESLKKYGEKRNA